MQRTELEELIKGLVPQARERVIALADARPLTALAGLPATIQPWRLGEVLRLRSKLATDTYESEGALWWSSVDRPVPVSCFRDAYLPAPAAQESIANREGAKAIEAYKRARANRTPEQRAEEAFEMRAAFGPGETVVDILTGEEFQV